MSLWALFMTHNFKTLFFYYLKATLTYSTISLVEGHYQIQTKTSGSSMCCYNQCSQESEDMFTLDTKPCHSKRWRYVWGQGIFMLINRHVSCQKDRKTFLIPSETSLFPPRCITVVHTKNTTNARSTRMKHMKVKTVHPNAEHGEHILKPLARATYPARHAPQRRDCGRWPAWTLHCSA